MSKGMWKKSVAYDSDEYRQWNRQRMEAVRSMPFYSLFENMLGETKARQVRINRIEDEMEALGRDVGVRHDGTPYVEKAKDRLRGKYATAVANPDYRVTLERIRERDEAHARYVEGR